MSRKVLIVDDEPHMLRLTELSLKKDGYQILTARSGREAIDLASRELPALIVMDVTMPEMDGITALRQLKATPATAAIPVIMLTTRGQTITRNEAQGSGAALYLTKPFSPSSLAAEARRLISMLPTSAATT
jgi:DNA-binding response OmpR family regulator